MDGIPEHQANIKQDVLLKVNAIIAAHGAEIAFPAMRRRGRSLGEGGEKTLIA
ncbi:MAG: hypothetical protein AB7U30_08375 [Sulfuricellaceae bacterium]|jgi:hypothetical protein